MPQSGSSARFALRPAGRHDWSAAGSGVTTSFGSAGPTFKAGGAALRLRFAGLGRGGVISHPRSLGLSVTRTEVTYARAGVGEWYRNSPLGLEQGFTLSRRPARNGWLTVSQRLAGGLTTRLTGGSVVFTRPGSHVPVLRYSGLSARDATGRSLPVRLRLEGSTILLQVKDTGARYPVTIDPLIQQGSNPDTFTVNDVGPPTVSLATPPDGSSTNQTQPTFTGTAQTFPEDSQTVTVDLYAGSDASGAPIQMLTANVGSDGSFSVPASAALADGTYTAQASQTEAGGDTGTSPVSTFTVDTHAPTVSLSSPANNTSTNNTQPTFAGTAGTQPGDSGSVQVVVYLPNTETPMTLTATVQPDGSYSVQAPSPLADGYYSFQATQSDSAGNVGKTPFGDFWVDTQPPHPSLALPANGSSTNQTQPQFDGSADHAGSPDSTQPATVQVALYQGSAATGTPVQTLTATTGPDADFEFAVRSSTPLADGTYTAQASQTDSAGNTGTGAPNTFTVDTVAPDITITQPTSGSIVAAEKPTISGIAGTQPGDLGNVYVAIYQGSDASGTRLASTSVTSGADGGYSAQFSLGGNRFSPGTYTVQAEQADSAGNVSTATVTFTIDDASPFIELDSPADGSKVNSNIPSFSGTAETGSGDSDTVQVNIYSGSDATGSPVQTLTTTDQSDGSYSVAPSTPLPDGIYTAQATQSDEVGNVGASAANTFTVDTVAPALSLTTPANGSSIKQSDPVLSGIAGTGPSDAGTVHVDIFQGSDTSGVRVASLATTVQPDGSYSVQPSIPLADGTYTAQASQSDDAGNTATATPTFTVDTVAPSISISAPGNGSLTNQRQPTFSGIAGTQPGDLDAVQVSAYLGTGTTGTPIQSLTTTRQSDGSYSVQASAPLADGTYTVQVSQSDAAANTGTATSTFTLDDTPPNTTISSGPASSSESNSAKFSFFSSAENSTFSCQLDNGNPAPCTSPVTYNGLADGTHTFTVTATDSLGNTDPTGATQTWSIDTSGPHTTISSGPANPTSAATAKLVFFSDHPASTFQCQIDDSSWQTCTSPKTYTGLSDGDHTFAARATDPAGLTDQTPATFSWTIGSYLLSLGPLKVLDGTPAQKHTIAPTISLASRSATLGTAYCAAAAKHPCKLTLQLTIPQTKTTTKTEATVAKAKQPKFTVLGSGHYAIKPDHHLSLRLILTHNAPTLLAKTKRLRAKTTLKLPGHKPITRNITLAVTHPKKKRH